MAQLPSVGYRKVVKAFRSFGWEVARQSGSHIVMTREQRSQLVGARA